jgi:ATP-dependent helicase/nuclease subunit A
MSARRKIPDEVLERQIAASDPAASAWVAANAGSGKTHVLAQRVIRLLLAGVDPAKILCITFTKAAAANMASRVFDELRRWTTLDDRALDAAIARMSRVAPEPALRARARRLFATALDTPGGLKVQTIHAFCTRLLHQFPFEANVAARFAVLDETSEKRLLNETSLAVMLEAAAQPDGALGRALAIAIAVAADRTFKEVVAEAIGKRDMVRAWIERDGGLPGALASLCASLGIDPDDTIARVQQEMIEGPLLPCAQWRATADALARGSTQDQDQADRLSAALAAAPTERALAYLNVFFTDKLAPRQRLATRAIDAKLAERLQKEQQRLCPLLERRKAVACRDRTAALLTIAEAVISRYQTAKNRRGILDYDDLIDKALTLLSEDRAAWVHYKLDQGIDHVLIDEAQDTSPKQWRIISLLTAEFFAGAGAREARRTIFAVGDEKQSIFSFQGAAPREFDAMRRSFAMACRAVERELQYLPFRHSFRSGPNVLTAVDQVFARPQAYTGLSADNVSPVHEWLPEAPPGMVEIWDTLKPSEKREIEAWDAPFDDLSERSPPVRLAGRIAREVRRWIRDGARAGNVLVLVRQRGALFEAIIRALKEAHIAVAGADRLVLTEHIAVMDLMVLADALLLPADDLALATILKSPLIGLDEQDLFDIAWQRRTALRTALRAKAQTEPRYAQAEARLARYAQWARQDTPFGFYSRVLGSDGGRARLLARLGHEADDALDELLHLALDYEQRETASLQGFVAWLRSAQTDVKRDMEMTRDEVRVMTVHGAKGLEAPIVVLADTTTPPAGPAHRQPRLLDLGTSDDSPGDGRLGNDSSGHFVWAGPRIGDVAPVAAARARRQRETEEEHRRLLYVAMTRASERLIVCGAEGRLRPPKDCWWNLVADALRPIALEVDGGDDEIRLWRYCPTLPINIDRREAFTTAGATELPPWLDRNAPAVDAAVRPLSPSRLGEEEAPPFRKISFGGGIAREQAIARGILMHRLLQSLPDLPSAARRELGRLHLARNGARFDAAEREAMLDQVCRLLDDPHHSALFLPGSRAEISIVGRLGPLVVSGQVDRIAVTPSEVLIADYKTNAEPPKRIEDAPRAYVRQLALYRAVLSGLYPGRTVRAVLVWTYTADSMEVPPASMDRELARVTESQESVVCQEDTPG